MKASAFMPVSLWCGAILGEVKALGDPLAP
jgi:hypothetical protein